MSKDIGGDIYNIAVKHKKLSDKEIVGMLSELKKLTKITKDKTSNVYTNIINMLSIKDRRIENSAANIRIVSTHLPDLDPIQAEFKRLALRIVSTYSLKVIEISKQREQAIQDRLKKDEIKENRLGLSETSKSELKDRFHLMAVNRQKAFARIISKWDLFVSNTFFNAITTQSAVRQLNENLYDKTKIRIGSTLDGETSIESLMAAVAERTEYVRALAKENGYTYCWNSNPMDPRTKPECISATLAGVVKEETMQGEYGFPPRFVCRCELVYTRGEWDKVNGGINQAIETARVRLIQELMEAPKQKATWYIKSGAAAGTWAKATDSVRATGAKMYSDIEKKLDTAFYHEVPEWFEGVGGI